jgi:hypothetical protein
VPNSHRQRIDQTVIYQPTNLETLTDIFEDLRKEFPTVPPKLMWTKSDDDGNLVINVPLDYPWPAVSSEAL